jgi:Photosystem P840 reaction-centre cytochrome c-551
MLLASTSVALGLIFVLIGGLNVWLVLEAWSRVKTARASSRMLALHRVGGYLFIALYCVMAYFMVARLGTDGGETSPTVTVHLVLALILSPLLFIKVLIARYYKNQHSLLLPIGLTIFVLAFVLIASTTGPYLARAGRPRAPAGLIDSDDASVLMQKRCSKCHTLDRIAGARKDAAGWAATVNRMRAMAGAGISEADAQTIVSFLTAQRRPPGSEKTAQLEVARALVDQRCSRCHPLDRVYKTVQGPEQWRETVTRMVDYAAGSTGAFHSGEDQQIIEFLSATQSPEAVNQRTAQADGAAAAGRSLIAQNDTTGAPPPPAPASQSNRMTLGFISVVCAAAITLVVRRPGARAAVSASASAPKPIKNAAPRPRNSRFVLQLVQVTPQTPDTKTLRFAVSEPRKLDAFAGPIPHVFVSVRREEGDTLLLDLFVTGAIGIRGDHAQTGQQRLRLGFSERPRGVRVDRRSCRSIGPILFRTGARQEDRIAGGRKRNYADDGDAPLSGRSMPRHAGHTSLLCPHGTGHHLPSRTG